MTMTVGTGPFGHKPGGEFNIDVPKRGVEYLEPFERHVRALIDGEAVVDSLGAKLLHVQHSLPVWCFPREDVRLRGELLTHTELLVQEPTTAAHRTA